MPRQPNTRPTSVYWLFDTRTNAPFYCGKTVYRLNDRLAQHRCAMETSPHRKISKRLRECGPHVGIQLMETVAIGADWAERERHWIRILREAFPGCANISNGGDGPAGLIHSEQTKAKLRNALKGRTLSDATRAKMSLARKGKKRPVGFGSKVRAALTGKKHTAKRNANRSAALKGRKLAPERIASMIGRKASDETRQKMREAQLRRPRC